MTMTFHANLLQNLGVGCRGYPFEMDAILNIWSIFPQSARKQHKQLLLVSICLVSCGEPQSSLFNTIRS